MNTNTLKTFAKASRIDLLDAVAKQILYWGFSEKGEILVEPSTTQGGFSFRGEVFNDVTVVPRWERLKEKITSSKNAFKDIAEEAAYTWFNRLIAIKVLEENGFIDPFLKFVPGTQTPIVLQNAKSGVHTLTHPTSKANLQKALLESDDEKAFGILLLHFCNNHPLLYQVFGKLDDYTEILIPQNLLAHNGFLATLNDPNQIPVEDFKEVELIGWLYQFYISDKKDEVFKGFKSNQKARPEDIPAATQIFTPKWIVKYMVENTLGKVYLDFEKGSNLKDQMQYLVENESDGKTDLIDDITQLTLIDPACGSGHILVVGFEWLYKMYREQGFSAKNAIESILKNNLFGLDIDDRAMQLARFAVLLKAAQQLKDVDVNQAVDLMNNPIDVIPHIYAFPERKSFTSEEVALFTENKHVDEVYKAFENLREGKNIGSALKISLSDEAREALIATYYDWNTQFKNGSLDLDQQAVFYTLKRYIEVALTLSKKYASVVANPPYMGQNSMNAQLKDYVNTHYPMTKADLFAVFMEVTLSLTKQNGLMGMINQHSWMFLSSFEKYREHVLNHTIIQSMLHLGPRTFEELSGEVVQSTAFVLENNTPTQAKGSYYRLVDYKSNNEKEEQFLKKNHFYPNIPQTNFDKIPGSPIAYWINSKFPIVFSENDCVKSISISDGQNITGNNDKYLKNIWEISKLKIKNNFWEPIAKGGNYRKWYGNITDVINWSSEARLFYKKDKVARIQNETLWFRPAVTWNLTAGDKPAFRLLTAECLFNKAAPSLLFKNDDMFIIKNVIAYFNSKIVYNILNILNPTLSLNILEVQKLPLELRWFNDIIYNYSNENISISKKDWDSRETSWDFEANPLLGISGEGKGISEKGLGKSSLRDSYEAWKAEVSQDFFQLHANEEELNRIFIDIYGLQEELTPEVALKDITILQDELKADDLEALETEFRGKGTVNLPIQQNIVMQQFLSYLVGTMLGRYRLDQPGLHIAHPNPSEEELASYAVDTVALPFQMQIDEDAIIPIMGSACAFPDDAVKRVDELIYRIWGEESHTENLNFLNQALGMPYEKWMCEQFWAYHISGTMYKKKPIYWLFCSNPKSPQKSAFRVLVYMHRMDAFTVQKILRNYLHPHMEFIRGKYDEMHANEANLSRQELKELDNLSKQMIELKDYEQILKDLANQQISFDLDDGVSVNYAKFKGAVAVIK